MRLKGYPKKLTYDISWEWISLHEQRKNDVQPSVVIHTWYLNENIMYDMMYDSCCDCFFKEKHLSM